MKTTTLRPGLLVSLKTTVRGGVNYQRIDLDPEHKTEQGTVEARWETTRTIENPEEFEIANKVRAKCRQTIEKLCARSDFGLLCPEAKREELYAAVDEARVLAEAFNRQASRSQVAVFVLTGRVAADDAEAVKAIASELRDLMASMQSAIKAAEPDEIRKAASRASRMASMLTDSVQGRVQEAVAQARDAAKALAERVVKGGEAAANVVQELKVEAIEAARFAFLDLETERPVEAIPEVGRGVDLAPAAEEPAAAPATCSCSHPHIACQFLECGCTVPPPADEPVTTAPAADLPALEV